MRRRVFQIILLFSLVLIVDRALFLLLDKCHQSVVHDSPQGLVSWYLRQNKKHDVVVFGASKSKHGIMAARINSDWFNLARGGMHEAYALCALSLIIEDGLVPKGVVLGVSPQHFYTSSVQEGEDVATSPQYFKYYYPVNGVIKDCIDRISIFEKFKYFFSSYRFNPDALNLLVGYARHVAGKGRSPFDGLLATQGFVGLSTFENEQLGESWYEVVTQQLSEAKVVRVEQKFDVQKLYYLNRFLSLCKESNIQVALVIMPQLIDMDPRYHTEGWRALEKLADQNEDVVLVDLASGSSAPELDWSCWSDRYHLSEKGAEKVTDALREALRGNPAWVPLIHESANSEP